MMTSSRRSFLKRSLAGSALVAAASAGLLAPTRVLAAWPKEAFEAKDTAGAASGLAGAAESGEISIKAPAIAENGAVVPVQVTSTLAGVKSISLLVESNGTPLSAVFNLASNTVADVSCRLKMGKTSNVIALVEAGGKLYKASTEVKVTIGGCGG